MVKWPGFVDLKRAKRFHEAHKGRPGSRAVLVEVSLRKRTDDHPGHRHGLDHGDDAYWSGVASGKLVQGNGQLPMASAHGLVPGQTKHEGDVAVASFVQRATPLPLFHRAGTTPEPEPEPEPEPFEP